MEPRPSLGALADAIDDIAGYLECEADLLRAESSRLRGHRPGTLLTPAELSLWVRETRIAEASAAERVEIIIRRAETARSRVEPIRVEVERRRSWWARWLSPGS